MKSLFFILFLSLNFLQLLHSQELIGMSARYDDSLAEWDIIDDSESQIGEFIQRWKLENDWREWDLRFGDTWGSVRQKWRNDNSRWELRMNGETITIKMHFPSDPTQWIVTNDRIALDYSSKLPYRYDEWQVSSKGYGKFSMNMYAENDPRDWEIFDNLNEEVTPSIRIALLFITMLVSTPK